MKVIGVGGFLCSGKSYICERFFRKVKNSLIINSDKISREIYSNDIFLSFLRKNCPDAVSEFGVNKKVIVEKVLLNYDLNREFCNISWKLISSLINNIINGVRKNYDVVFIEAALITELDINFDKLIWVEVSDVDVYKNRIEQRNPENLKNIIGILEFQRTIYDPTLIKFDYVIDNTTNITSKYELIDILSYFNIDYDDLIKEG